MKRGLIILWLIFLAVSCLYAEQSALLVPLRGGAAELEREIQQNCQELERLLTAEGVHVTTESTASGIIRFLRNYAEKSTASDELSVYLFGHVSAGAKRISLATRDGRLSGSDFAEALLGGKAKKTVYLFCTQSAALFDLFAVGNVRVLSATDDPGQLNPPRYGTFFVAAKKEMGPKASFERLAGRAGELTGAFYQSNHLALSENARMFFDGKQVSYPFDGTKTASVAVNTNPADDLTVSELRKTLSKKWKLVPCSESQKKQLAEARAAAKAYSKYPFVVLKRSLKLSLNPDKSALAECRETCYLNESRRFLNGFGRVSAQIIFPDNTFAEVEAAPGELPLIPGSLVTVQNVVVLPPPSHLPEFHFEWPLQLPVPVLETEIALAQPSALKVYTGILPRNTGKEQILKNGLKIGFLPAFSPLPGEFVQPERWVATTLGDWKEFHRWTTRMSDRALELSPESGKFLERLVKDVPSQADKVKAVYDYLNALRYSTIPVGAAAFRPQKIDQIIFQASGDCKDKATALSVFCRELGVPAWRVLIKRGGTIEPGFPAWQFNHMLVYIPKLDGFPDGLWLDPTDGATEFGDLPPGDDGSLGFVLKDDSFEFRKVALSGKVKNSVLTEIELDKTSGGKELLAKIVTKRTGFAQYLFLQEQKNSFPEQRRYTEEKELARLLPGFSLESSGPDATTATGPLQASVTGLNLLPADLKSLFISRERTRPVRLFDGRPITFITRVTRKDKPFPSQSFERSCDGFSLSVNARGGLIVLRAEFRGGDLSPETYRKIRAILLEAETIFSNKD